MLDASSINEVSASVKQQNSSMPINIQEQVDPNDFLECIVFIYENCIKKMKKNQVK